jgi:predicted nuclease of restriction endonuclease-like RecB superfamily
LSKKSGKFRSALEKEFSKEVKRKGFKYEPYGIPYTVHRTYMPDFVHEEKKVMVEVKGFFRVGDTLKYKSIRDTILEDGWELIFLLSNEHKKVRKGGKITMGQWCDKEGLKHYTLSTAQELVKYVEGKE